MCFASDTNGIGAISCARLFIKSDLMFFLFQNKNTRNRCYGKGNITLCFLTAVFSPGNIIFSISKKSIFRG
jgi:hypothetical protein